MSSTLLHPSVSTPLHTSRPFANDEEETSLDDLLLSLDGFTCSAFNKEMPSTHDSFAFYRLFLVYNFGQQLASTSAHLQTLSLEDEGAVAQTIVDRLPVRLDVARLAAAWVRTYDCNIARAVAAAAVRHKPSDSPELGNLALGANDASDCFRLLGDEVLVIPRGDTPVSEFNHPLFPRIIPLLFSYGIGGSKQDGGKV